MKPVIDIHTHIFNALDIPIKGYLMSRKAKTFMESLFRPLFPVFAKCIRNQLKQNIRQNFLKRLICKIVKFIFFKAQGKNYESWVKTMTCDVNIISQEMTCTFEKDNIDLYIPLMIDYEYWFMNTPDNLIEDQIDYIYKNVILKSGGKIHPFVPFDPARELAFIHKKRNPDGCPEHSGSFKLVQDAIENKGFIGVKLYNSLGYRPINNSISDNNRRKIPLHRKKDYKTNYHEFSGKDYDDVLRTLYDWCQKNEVPITAHCVMDGIESYNKASYDFGQAIFWKDVLEEFPGLHLNLAHFGWNEKSIFGSNEDWVKEICDIIIEKDGNGNYKYPDLYTDVSCHKVTERKEKLKILERYNEILNYLHNESDVRHFKEQLLFGTDWHVLKRLNNFESFKINYEEILTSCNWTSSEIENFLGVNALGFLCFNPGEKNRIRLENFYIKENMEVPKWLKMGLSQKYEI